ncbi:MAG: hypothetical protein JWR77_88, partial [Rhizorhabdus sp.]|nr:hypothetical protein [Rhizorhabdus sp.]
MVNEGATVEDPERNAGDGCRELEMQMECAIAQRGRALIDFEVGVRQAASRMQGKLEVELTARGVTALTLPLDMDARHDMIDAALADVPSHATRALLGDWSAREHGRVCEQAFAEV